MTYHATAIVTLTALLLYFWMATRVAAARRRAGIPAPAMTGDATLERTLRAQGNTLEWLPIFVPSLWLFAIYWNDLWAAAIGVVWIIGRLIYHRGYVTEARRRAPGFLIQTVAATTLLLGALGRAIYDVLMQV